jgi:hypothetical protein
MRNCPVCDHNGKRVIFNDYCGTSMVNKEVNRMCLFECTSCGHRYLDALHLTQAWFDDYYTDRYETDDKEYSDERLNSLAACVAIYKPINVLDIGGMDGELQGRLKERGTFTVVSGVRHVDPQMFGAVILSHTLEHVYDVPAMFARIKAALIPGGLLFVEVPIHMGYKEPTAYDYHWQHVNKFRPFDLLELIGRNGFDYLVSMPLPDYREYECWRIAGRQRS